MILATTQTPAELGDAIGYYAQVIIVGLAIIIGFVALIQWRDRHAPGDTFSDDFVPDRADVAATEQRHVIGDGRIATAINRTIRVARDGGAR